MGEFWEKITGSIGTGNGAGGSGPPKWFRRDNLLILVLLGVLLFIIALPVKKEEPQAASVGTETAEQYNAGIFTSPSQTTGEQETAVDTETRAVAAGSAEEYTAYLEGKLKNTGYQTVYQDGSQGTPFVVKTITPKVEGVLVVAEGAGKGNMTSEITQIAQALFGVEAHKIKVLEK